VPTKKKKKKKKKEEEEKEEEYPIAPMYVSMHVRRYVCMFIAT